MNCEHCHKNIELSMVYNTKCISPYHPAFKIIMCQFICYLVTLLVSLAAIGVILYVVIKYFREGEDSIVSVIFAFIFLAILIGVVIRMLIEIVLNFRIKELKQISLIQPLEKQLSERIEEKSYKQNQMIEDHNLTVRTTKDTKNNTSQVYTNVNISQTLGITSNL